MDDLNLIRINSVLDHIDLIFRDMGNLSLEEFQNNSLLLRATCFSLSQVGEMMNQLEKHLSNEYPDLPWLSARKMRNIIVHDYKSVDSENVYKVIKLDLPELKAAFIKIKDSIK